MTTMAPERTFTTSTDKPNVSHIVLEPAGDETAHALVLRARVEGFEVEALCGFRWIPYRNPQDLDVCQKCVEIYQQPGDNRDDREELPDA